MYINFKSSDMWFWSRWASENKDFIVFALEEGSGFVNEADHAFDHPDYEEYDPARCGAFADWLDEHRDRLLEPHTDQRAEAEERLDSLIKWLRSGL